MKKILLSLFAFMALAPFVQAGECNVITDVNDYYVEVVSGVNMRDQVCDGNVIGTLSAGTTVKVTGHIEDWRYIENPDGGSAFIWSDFVAISEQPEDEELEDEQPAGTLPDVNGHQYEAAIRYLESNGIIQGYPDGTYKPQNSVNRAEFTKIIVESKLGSNPTGSASSCFPDVNASDWFASYVCYAKDNGIIGGYPDGTFKPGDTINLAEASKILVNTLEVSMASDAGGPWYQVFIESLQAPNYIPSTFSDFGNNVSRSQMAEMIWRILEDITNQSSKTFTFETQPSNNNSNVNACLDNHIPNNVDMNEIRQSWLAWHNAARTTRGLNTFVMNEGLDYSSSIWAKSNADDGTITHDRDGGQAAADWFTSVGVNFKALNGFVFGENLGLRTYTCDSSDCADEMEDAIKHLFDAFMAEEGTNYTGHYDNIVEGDFNEIGLGLAIEDDIVYLTTHYAQGVENYPDTCQ